MHPNSFTSTKRGQVKQTIKGFWAFHPAPLPKKLALDEEAINLLVEATAAVNRLGGLGLLIPNPHLLISPHLRIEAILSSRIEGTQTEVPQLLQAEAEQAKANESNNDLREVQNYISAIEHGISRVRGGFPISSRLLREMHEILLQGVRGRQRMPGELRKSPVWIGGSTLDNAVFVPPPPDVMTQSLTELEFFIQERDMPLLVQIALVHYQFEVIHPFLDGNGRLGRMLIPLMLLERETLVEPLLYLSAFFEQNRSEYYDLLLSTSQHGDLMAWLKFFLLGVKTQAYDAEMRIQRLVKLQTEFRNDLLAEGKPASVLRLADYLFAQPLVSAALVARALEVTPPTANASIKALVQRGDLTEISGRKRFRLFQAPKIYDAVFGDIDTPPSAERRRNSQ